MRALSATLAAIGVLFAAAPATAGAASGSVQGAASGSVHAAASGSARPAAARALQKTLSGDLRSQGGASGAYVLDLTTGSTLFSAAADAGRLPASVEKIYTTSTALLRMGPDATLTTDVYGVGTLDGTGHWTGSLYIRGDGDPTFGSASFDRSAYGTGATIERLAANLVRATGIKSVSGRVEGDESYFDSLRGTPPSGGLFSVWVEGSLSALAFDRGLTNQGAAYILHPAAYAAQQFVSALRGAGVKVTAHTSIGSARTPASAHLLALVNSPRLATLIRLTNTPSDNFFAEMLLKGLGARFAGAGTTPAGAAIVQSEVASAFGIKPQLVDGSGLSRDDYTTPRQVVTALGHLATNKDFVESLALAGHTGTLEYEMQGTPADGRCRGKTGTLSDVGNLAGYCTAKDGHTLAFAFLMNGVDPTSAHAMEDQMAVSLATYNG